MKALLPAIAVLAFGTSAFGSTITLDCAPTALTNSVVLGTSTAVTFVSGHGTGSFACNIADAALGAVTLNSVTVDMFADYQFGNGALTDPNDNSAGFTFTETPETWALAHGSPTLPVTTMNLSTGVTLFVIGNASSSGGHTFTNTGAGGLLGTTYIEPMADAQTGTLAGAFTIPVTAFVDAGGFKNGQSIARVQAVYDYTVITGSVPEPVSMALVGGGLLGIALLGRRRFARK